MTADTQTLAVITGGSRGIGFGIAKQLAAKHDILVVCRSSPIEDNIAELKNVRPNATIEYMVGLDCAETQKVTM
jgi:NAD(P)-dependent dehydrogenase (short-subunit alcohol dehydrogenase family)